MASFLSLLDQKNADLSPSVHATNSIYLACLACQVRGIVGDSGLLLLCCTFDVKRALLSTHLPIVFHVSVREGLIQSSFITRAIRVIPKRFKNGNSPYYIPNAAVGAGQWISQGDLSMTVPPARTRKAARTPARRIDHRHLAAVPVRPQPTLRPLL